MTRNYNPSKCILVAGGAGFLGSHLMDRIPTITDRHNILT